MTLFVLLQRILLQCDNMPTVSAAKPCFTFQQTVSVSHNRMHDITIKTMFCSGFWFH